MAFAAFVEFTQTLAKVAHNAGNLFASEKDQYQDKD
jgi:hypothetical protein